jgi:hypothetical protein
MLVFIASLLPGTQKAQQASNAAVRQACINLDNATANAMAIPGAWSGLNATEQQTALSQLKTCLSEGYIQSIPAPGQSSSSSSSSWGTALVSLSASVSNITTQQQGLWESWNNGTVDANQFGNQTNNLRAQLEVLGNQTMGGITVPTQWQVAYGDYGTYLATLEEAFQLEVIYAHSTFVSSAVQAQALDNIASTLSEAVQDLNMSRAAWPSSVNTVTAASTSSYSASSSTSQPYLYFQVSCTDCGGGLPNIVSYFPGVNASAAQHSQYYGYYDYTVSYEPGTLFNQPLPPSNGTQTFRIELASSSTLADWGFERMTANGTLQVQLLSSNGTLIYQGSATGSNSTVFSP